MTLDVDNDTPGDFPLDPTTVQIVGTDSPGDPLVVPGEGSWTVDPVTGAITFTPKPGFEGNPTVINYTVSDTQGNVSNPATVTVTYITGFEPIPVNALSIGGLGLLILLLFGLGVRASGRRRFRQI